MLSLLSCVPSIEEGYREAYLPSKQQIERDTRTHAIQRRSPAEEHVAYTARFAGPPAGDAARFSLPASRHRVQQGTCNHMTPERIESVRGEGSCNHKTQWTLSLGWPSGTGPSNSYRGKGRTRLQSTYQVSSRGSYTQVQGLLACSFWLLHLRFRV